MNGEVDRAGDECLLDFLGEQAFAAGLGQWPILNHVPRGADDFDLDPAGVEAGCRGEAAFHLVGLYQRQRRAARTNAQRGLQVCGLCHRTFRC